MPSPDISELGPTTAIAKPSVCEILPTIAFGHTGLRSSCLKIACGENPSWVMPWRAADLPALNNARTFGADLELRIVVSSACRGSPFPSETSFQRQLFG